MTQPQCTAMTRASGGTVRCKRLAMVGTTVCAKHGGPLALATTGPGNPNWKDGRHSKIWKDARLRERYEEALNDPEMLAYRSEIAVLDALLSEEIEAIGVDAGTAERLWSRANDLMVDFEVALRNRDASGQQEAFLALRDVVRSGMRDAEARREARRLIQERSTVADRESRRLMQMQNVMTSEQAYILFQAIMYEINEQVTDTGDRIRLNNRLLELAGSARL